MRRVTRVDDPSDETAAYESALRILAGRAHSSVQLQKKLVTKGFDADVVERTVSRLRREKWISDEEFAQEFARSRARRQQGGRRIERELEARGVSKETAAGALATLEESAPEAERLEQACARKLEAMLRRSSPEEMQSDTERKKLAAFLLKQGYEASDIIDEVDRQLRRIKN